MNALRELCDDGLEEPPPWGDFVKGRDSDMLRMRIDFTTRLETMHARTFARHSPAVMLVADLDIG